MRSEAGMSGGERKNGMMGMAASFRWAFSGIWQATRTQRNMKIHWLAAVLAIGLGAWLGLEPGEWAAVILACSAVLGAECMNTAVEAVVDLASPERHSLAKRAKDCAAGAVLLCAIGAAATGVVVFGGKLATRCCGDLGCVPESACETTQDSGAVTSETGGQHLKFSPK